MAELPENPFVVDDNREALRQMLEASNKLALATAPLDEQVTGLYTMNVLIAATQVANTGPETGIFACVWELGRFIQKLYGEDMSPDVRVSEVPCGHAECKMHHEREAAISEAALRGDGDALVGVCKSSMREAVQRGEIYPEREVMKLYTSTLINVCLAFSADVRIAEGDPDNN